MVTTIDRRRKMGGYVICGNNEDKWSLTYLPHMAAVEQIKKLVKEYLESVGGPTTEGIERMLACARINFGIEVLCQALITSNFYFNLKFIADTRNEIKAIVQSFPAHEEPYQYLKALLDDLNGRIEHYNSA
ncbi:MAG: hypothetical protein V1867_08235 [Candidatus Falkowbacteria bacterium]